jgi:hypothetical protein
MSCSTAPKQKLESLLEERLTLTRENLALLEEFGSGGSHTLQRDILKADAQQKLDDWRQDYNEVRPHSALGQQTPREFAASGALTFQLDQGWGEGHQSLQFFLQNNKSSFINLELDTLKSFKTSVIPL